MSFSPVSSMTSRRAADAFSFSGQNSGGFTPDLDTLEQDGYFINDLR